MKRAIFILTFFLASAAAFGQMGGPQVVTLGATPLPQYSYDSQVGQVLTPVWEIVGGTPGSTTATSMHFTINVTWNSTGTGIVRFKNGSTLLGTLNVTVNPPIPAVPSPTGPAGITTNSFSFSWPAVSGATSYRVDVSTTPFSPTPNYVGIYNDYSVTATSVGIGNLTDGTLYYYRVRSANGSGTSASSTAITATTLTGPLTGQNPATIGHPYLYEYVAGGNVASPTWLPVGGTVGATVNTGLYHSAYLTWNSVGTAAADFYSGTTILLGHLSVAVVPGPPTLTNVTGCGTVDLSGIPGTGGTTLRWYTVLTGGTYFQGNTYSVTPGATTTYYVTSYNSSYGETVERTPVTLTIIPPPTISPTVTGNGRFGPGTVTLTASGAPAGGSYNWYNPSGGLVGTGPSYTPAQTFATTTPNFVYVKANNGCDGPQTWVTVSVYTCPVITGGQQVVNGAQVILDGGAGFDLYTWKNSIGQTVQCSTTQTFPTSTPDTYTVTVTKGTLTCVSAPFTVGGQFYNQNLNYIVTNTVMVDNVLTPAAVDILPVASKTQTIQYFDGLGRPAQTVATQASPLGKDIVTPIAYDEYGRENRKYLPFANGTNGWMQGGLLDANKNYTGAPLTFYTNAAKVAHDTQRPFSETVFEVSPLNRPSKDYGPGSAWAPSPIGSDKYVEHKYLNNQHGTSAEQEKIIAWQINSTSGALELSTSTNTDYVLSGGYYASKQLNIKITVDEKRGNAVREYSDKLGHTVLKKVQIVAASTDLNNESQWASTYYVYDNAGNLSIVLPPEAVKVLLGF